MWGVHDEERLTAVFVPCEQRQELVNLAGWQIYTLAMQG